ncbi:MAG: LLM class F420-dependent oxidoreductase [Ktedonobacterales bacterium]
MQSVHLSFGVKTAPQHTTYEAMQRVWHAADETPEFEHAWLFDHFIPLGPDPTGPIFEGWTLLGALAAQTQRIRLGLMVTGNTYRHPAILANIGATVDVISHGRLDMGLGAGWHEVEHHMYGMTLPPPGERIRRFAEACEVIKLLWTETEANFEGQFYHLHDARCEPKPVQRPYPPFVIGGSGEQRTLRVVAQYASVWNFAGGPVEDFAHKSAVLDERCAEIGRDPAAIARSIQQRVDYADLAATREALRPFIAAGASHLVLNLTYPYPDDIVARLAAEVVRPLHSEYEGES